TKNVARTPRLPSISSTRGYPTTSDGSAPAGRGPASSPRPTSAASPMLSNVKQAIAPTSAAATDRSAAREARRPLLDERRDAFPEVVRPEERHELHEHVVRVRLEVLAEAVAIEPLHRLHGERRVRRDLRRPPPGLGAELPRRHDRVHEAEMQRPLG